MALIQLHELNDVGPLTTEDSLLPCQATIGSRLGAIKPADIVKNTSIDDIQDGVISKKLSATEKDDLFAHTEDTANPHSVTKVQVGLDNVDNTSDLNKPVSTAVQSALDLKANEADLLSHNHSGVYEPADPDLQTHLLSSANPHNVTPDQIGLGNVDNTSDADKPISTAQQTEFNLKAYAANAALTGVPTAPTAAAGTNTTQIATTAFVQAADVALHTGRKNYIINGIFDIWQRGVTANLTTAATVFVADRWATTNTSATIATAVAQQAFELTPSLVPNNPKYYIRHTVTGGSAASDASNFRQKIEGVRSLSGKTATFSFYARGTAGNSMAISRTQYFGTGGTPSAYIDTAVQKITLTADWQKFVITVNIESIADKTLGTNDNDWFGFIFWFSAGSSYDSITNNLGLQTGYFDIAQVQLEEGSVATEFERRTYADEQFLCFRYCYKLVVPGSAYLYAKVAQAFSYSDSGALPVEMRVVPVVTTLVATTNTNCSSVALSASQKYYIQRVTPTADTHYRALGGEYLLDAEL